VVAAERAIREFLNLKFARKLLKANVREPGGDGVRHQN
jgi:hypothetical protein